MSFREKGYLFTGVQEIIKLRFWQLYPKFISFISPVDSTVLAYVLKKLNEEHNYGLDLILLSVDEGITGYRDDSLEVQYDIDSRAASELVN